MTDEYATLRTAFHAGATIQAYTVEGDDGQAPLSELDDRGYWRDLDGEPEFSCHPTRYRVRPTGHWDASDMLEATAVLRGMKDQHPAEAPVALIRRCETAIADLNDVCEYFEERSDVVDGDYGAPEANREMLMVQALETSIQTLGDVRANLRPDPEASALRAELERLRKANDHYQIMMNTAACDEYRNRMGNAEATIARVRAMADEWEVEAAKLRAQGAKAQRRGDDNDAEVCFTAGQDTLAFVHELRAALEGSNG